MGPGGVARRRDDSRHDELRQRVADLLNDVAALESNRPALSRETVQEFPTTAFWLQHGVEVSSGEQNPLVTGQLGDEHRRVANLNGEQKSIALLEQIDLVSLVEAKKAFMSGSQLAEGELTPDEFIDAFEPLVQLSREELGRLFMKIDHNSDGLVSWLEFVSFMFLNVKGAEASKLIEGALHHYVPHTPVSQGPGPHAHREAITRILYISAKNHYVSVSRDGTLRVWDATTLDHVTTVTNSAAWINDAVCLSDPSITKLAVAASDRTLSLYELSAADSRKKYALHGRMTLPDLALCLAYWVEGADTPVLACGDDTGCVSVYDARTLVQAVSRQRDVPGFVDQPVSRRTRLYVLRLHADWVTAISFVPALSALLSASLDGSVKLVDLSRQRDENGDGVLDAEELSALHTLRGHSKGVFACTHISVSGRHLGASASIDRSIVVWNLETGDRLAELSGHRTYVHQMAADPDKEHLLTLAADGELKVWDLHHFTCFQTIPALGNDKLAGACALAFNAAHSSVVTGAKGLTLWQRRRWVVVPLAVIKATSLAPNGHKVPLVAVTYCTLYGLVLSADESSVICVWDVRTGGKLFRFQHQGGKLTCMCLDETERRLVTGADTGHVTIYNFSSGEALRELLPPAASAAREGRNEVTQLLSLRVSGVRSICAVGWCRDVWIWPDAPAGEQPSRPRELKGHRDDILSASLLGADLLVRAAASGWPGRRWHRTPLLTFRAFFPTSRSRGGSRDRRAQATGAHDGEVIVWDLHHLCIKHRLRVSPSPIPTPMLESRAIEGLRAIAKANTRDEIPASEQPRAGASASTAYHTAPSTTIVAACDNGSMWFWDSGTGHVECVIEQASEPGESLTAIAADDEGCVVLTGDSGGFLRLWDVVSLSQQEQGPAQAAGEKEGGVRLLLSWCAHAGAVLSAEYLASMHGFVTSGFDSTVRMWSAAGAQVGIFGQRAEWSLDDRETWLDASVCRMGTVHREKVIAGQDLNASQLLPPPVLASLMARAGHRVRVRRMQQRVRAGQSDGGAQRHR